MCIAIFYRLKNIKYFLIANNIITVWRQMVTRLTVVVVILILKHHVVHTGN